MLINFDQGHRNIISEKVVGLSISAIVTLVIGLVLNSCLTSSMQDWGLIGICRGRVDMWGRITAYVASEMSSATGDSHHDPYLLWAITFRERGQAPRADISPSPRESTPWTLVP